ncbi:MAG: VWA domain-containing protein [Alphaproteobacteria bacterium]|nr:VWA domain-containing protein [Alphaproteobacteria bacterium]
MSNITKASKSEDVDRFLEQVKSLPPAAPGGKRGRLILAMDATMSRQSTWDRALSIQAQMFNEAGRVGGLDVQLVFFRGFNQCQASRWTSDAAALGRLMSGVRCMGGHTQIRRVLSHVRNESRDKTINAVVYVGDAMEETIDSLAQAAGEVGLLGVPIFMFQEGRDPVTEAAYREIARLTRGAYFRFGADSAKILGELLSAVAVYAAGGAAALADHSATHGGSARLLLAQMKSA